MNTIRSSAFLRLSPPPLAFAQSVKAFGCQLHEEIQPGTRRMPDCYMVTRPATQNTIPVPVHLATPEVLQYLIEEDDRRHRRTLTINLPCAVPGMK